MRVQFDVSYLHCEAEQTKLTNNVTRFTHTPNATRWTTNQRTKETCDYMGYAKENPTRIDKIKERAWKYFSYRAASRWGPRLLRSFVPRLAIRRKQGEYKRTTSNTMAARASSSLLHLLQLAFLTNKILSKKTGHSTVALQQNTVTFKEVYEERMHICANRQVFPTIPKCAT